MEGVCAGSIALLSEATQPPINTEPPHATTQVPGLAESRPSVMLGDRVLAQHAGREWEAYVHHVEQEAVLLRFNHHFHAAHVNGARYRIRFVLKRSSFVW